MEPVTILPAHPDRTAEATLAAYGKQRIALRYWLLGAGMHDAVAAMDFAEQHHAGTRKDGFTPEFAHQVAIVSYLRTLGPHLDNPAATYAAGFLHDVREDYDLPDIVIRSRFGDTVADAVDAMTKTFAGSDRDLDTVFAAIAGNPVASIAKLADRIHNLDSMIGVFTTTKALQYAQETRERFLPMLHQVRRAFPTQEAAYENAKLVLTSQVRLIELLAAHTAATTTP